MASDIKGEGIIPTLMGDPTIPAIPLGDPPLLIWLPIGDIGVIAFAGDVELLLIGLVRWFVFGPLGCKDTPCWWLLLLLPVEKYPLLRELKEGVVVLAGIDETESIIEVWIADVFIEVTNGVDKGDKIVVLGDDGTWVVSVEVTFCSVLDDDDIGSMEEGDDREDDEVCWNSLALLGCKALLFILCNELLLLLSLPFCETEEVELLKLLLPEDHRHKESDPNIKEGLQQLDDQIKAMMEVGATHYVTILALAK